MQLAVANVTLSIRWTSTSNGRKHHRSHHKSPLGDRSSVTEWCAIWHCMKLITIQAKHHHRCASSNALESHCRFLNSRQQSMNGSDRQRNSKRWKSRGHLRIENWRRKTNKPFSNRLLQKSIIDIFHSKNSINSVFALREIVIERRYSVSTVVVRPFARYNEMENDCSERNKFLSESTVRRNGWLRVIINTF